MSYETATTLEKRTGGRRKGQLTEGSVSHRLSTMAVGDTIFIEEWNDSSVFYYTYKSRARDSMGEPNAQWRSKATPRGLAITRTA